MSVLTIILPEVSVTDSSKLIGTLFAMISEHLHSDESSTTIQHSNEFINLVHEHRDSYIIVSIKPKMPQFQLIKHGDAIYKAAATWLATYIIDHYEHILLKQAIKRRGFTKQETIQKIEEYCQSILNHDQWDGLSRSYTEVDRRRRTSKIEHELSQYFEHEVTCRLEGILSFRLRPYKKEIGEIVEYACDEFILNQQYEEFISLLKYFVQIQESKIETVHVFQDDRGFAISDEQYRPISLNEFEDRIVIDMLETEINIDDTIISHLVAVSPKKIVLHSHMNDLYETKTLRSIFADRVEHCHGCHLCIRNKHETIPIH